MTLKSSASDPEMFGPPDAIAPPPDAAMFGGGSEDSYPPTPDLAKSLLKPTVTEEPKARSLHEVASDTGQPGDGLPSGSLPYGLHATQAQKQSVKDDRGTVTTFISDLPQK